MTRQQWYHRLLQVTREQYEMGDIDLRTYEAATLALVREWTREERVRADLAAQIRQQRREGDTCTG